MKIILPPLSMALLAVIASIAAGYTLLFFFYADWPPSDRPYSVRFQNQMIGLAFLVLWISTIFSGILFWNGKIALKFASAFLFVIGAFPIVFHGFILCFR